MTQPSETETLSQIMSRLGALADRANDHADGLGATVERDPNALMGREGVEWLFELTRTVNELADCTAGLTLVAMRLADTAGRQDLIGADGS